MKFNQGQTYAPSQGWFQEGILCIQIHGNVKEKSLWTVVLKEENLMKKKVQCEVGIGVILG